MKKYKIEGVQPFNKFSFRSCYYHQLIAALSCFGISFESVLLSSFVFAGKDLARIFQTLNWKKFWVIKTSVAMFLKKS